MNRDDGGPAFPCWSEKDNHGMSLRDYFAGQALAAMLPTIQVKDWDNKDEAIVAHVSGLAYEIADAMLAERAK